MRQICNTRAFEARASRNSCGGSFRDCFTALALRWPLPIAAHNVHPRMRGDTSEVCFRGRRES